MEPDKPELTPRQIADRASLDCTVCDYAQAHGDWGPDIKPDKTHCSRCHRSWRSYREAHCVVCCRHFINSNAADAHRVEDGCRNPSSLTRRDGKPKFTTVDRGKGVVYKLVNYRERPDFIS